jgi:hypothetical protein
MNTKIDNKINSIVDHELDKSKTNKHISKISPDMDLRYNSLNICVGPQGTSKTTFFMKNMMKLCHYPNNYHLIIYVSNNDNDETVEKLKSYISIQIVKSSYSNIPSLFESLMVIKEEYWNLFKNNAGEEEKRAQARLLYIPDDKELNFNIQTMIFCDDAGWFLDKKSPFNNILCGLRHIQCTFWLNIQVWTSVNPSIKDQISNVYITRGIPVDKLQHIFRQVSSGLDFNGFLEKYNCLKYRDKLLVDNKESNVKIINNF